MEKTVKFRVWSLVLDSGQGCTLISQTWRTEEEFRAMLNGFFIGFRVVEIEGKS